MPDLSPPSHTANIIVVDDTPDNLRLLFSVLVEQGYRVRPVPSGKMALVAIEKELPDLILLDIMMPHMDGYAVCATLKASARTRDIPIIFLSALDRIEDKVRALTGGGVDYITKPFQTAEVLARVANHLALQRMQNQLREQNAALHEANAQLQQRNHQMELLNQMSVFLQRAESSQQAIDLSLPFIRQLFSTLPGALYLLNDSQTMLEQVATWGLTTPHVEQLAPDDCQAFAGTRMHLAEDPADAYECTHCRAACVLPYLCIQLQARGEIQGLLYLRHMTSTATEFGDYWQRLATIVADHLALSLSNLHLLSRLQQQAAQGSHRSFSANQRTIPEA